MMCLSAIYRCLTGASPLPDSTGASAKGSKAPAKEPQMEKSPNSQTEVKIDWIFRDMFFR